MGNWTDGQQRGSTLLYYVNIVLGAQETAWGIKSTVLFKVYSLLYEPTCLSSLTPLLTILIMYKCVQCTVWTHLFVQSDRNLFLYPQYKPCTSVQCTVYCMNPHDFSVRLQPFPQLTIPILYSVQCTVWNPPDCQEWLQSFPLLKIPTLYKCTSVQCTVWTYLFVQFDRNSFLYSKS